MLAWQIHENGAAAQRLEIALPQPDTGAARVRIAACGLNFADLLMQEGRYQEHPALPYIPGMEFSGRIDAFGPGAVTDLHQGQRVAVFAGIGGMAEFAVVPVDRLVAIPGTMSFVQAAGFQVAYGTSHLALDHKARLQPGETLLVLGAAGGVGLTAVEIGKRMGARVIACARGPEKRAVAMAAGADAFIDSDTPDLKAAFKAIGGVDVVYDPVGGAGFDAALSACRPEGRLLAIGFASGQVPQVPANRLLVKNLSVMGLYWGGYLSFAPHILTQSLRTLFGWYAEGSLRPHISHVLPFQHYPDGLDLLRSRQATGKIVIQISES
jgi:NADPH:quinone reductase